MVEKMTSINHWAHHGSEQYEQLYYLIFEITLKLPIPLKRFLNNLFVGVIKGAGWLIQQEDLNAVVAQQCPGYNNIINNYQLHYLCQNDGPMLIRCI